MAAGKRRIKVRNGVATEFLDSIDDALVVAAIEKAERHTNGQIRVHVSKRPHDEDIEQAARRRFRKLRMANTSHRNAVLIYVAPGSHQLYVMGDISIDQLCGPGLWSEAAAELSAAFADGFLTEGIVAAIGKIGAALAEHFPSSGSAGPADGLPDEVSRD